MDTILSFFQAVSWHFTAITILSFIWGFVGESFEAIPEMKCPKYPNMQRFLRIIFVAVIILCLFADTHLNQAFVIDFIFSFVWAAIPAFIGRILYELIVWMFVCKH